MLSRRLSEFLRSRFSLTYRSFSKDDKPYPATFVRISLKSNEASSTYAPTTSFFTLIPYNPGLRSFSKKQKRLHIIKLQLCAKNQKIEQTDEQRLNHKSQLRYGWQKSAKVDPVMILPPKKRYLRYLDPPLRLPQSNFLSSKILPKHLMAHLSWHKSWKWIIGRPQRSKFVLKFPEFGYFKDKIWAVEKIMYRNRKWF